MCGLVGIASTKSIESRAWLTHGTDALAHRGPDDAGLWWSEDGCVGFGHRRLSILDLSPAGHQPMQDPSSGCTLVFNGEIYNHDFLRTQLVSLGHKFRSRSDTEVILAAYSEWGFSCLDHLKGMFAFVLFDPAARKIFMARDRAGEKPLFYSLLNGTLKFGSELKSLFCDESFPRNISARSLDIYLGMGYVPGSDCIIENVHKLPAGKFAVFDMLGGGIETMTYWRLPLKACSSEDPVNDDQLLDELEELLENSTRLQLLADVPVGILLSGGVDSSLITAIASRFSGQLKTFTVGFPSFGSHDETGHARLIANHFGTEHVELDAGNIGPEILVSLARQFDEPIVDSSMVPTYLVSQLVREHCTVALGGDGADELFGGYSHYSRNLKTAMVASYVPKLISKTIYEISTRLLPQGFRGRYGLRSLASDFERGLPLASSLFDEKYRKNLLLDSSLDISGESAEKIWKSRTPIVTGLLDRTTRMDFSNYLPEDILVKIDRASMMNSLELRAPFLSPDLIEFAFSRVPSRLKATTSQRKIILKRLAMKLLPSGFDLQRKQGFSIPLNQWLKSGPWREFFADILYDSQTIFNHRSVDELFKGIDSGRPNGERLFCLVMFELWRREYNIRSMRL